MRRRREDGTLKVYPLASQPLPWPVPVALALMLGASTAVLLALMRRWTTQGRLVALWDWCAANEFHLRRTDHAELPDPLRTLTRPAPRLVMLLESEDELLVQIETVGAAGAEFRAQGSAKSESSVLNPSPLRWNLLLRRLKVAWPVTGLRPHAAANSILDFFPLSDLHAMAPSERFVLYGAELLAARRISASMLRGLLPPDIGLVLVDSWLLLDFSTRPFDSLTLQRVTGLSEQLAAHLPNRPVATANG